MLQSIRAIIDPDGTIRPLEAIQVVVPTQAIITLLTDTPPASPTPPIVPIGSAVMDRDRVHEIFVAGEVPQVVESVPGWAHDITNIGSEEMVVMLWANEIFDHDRPDTIKRKV